MTTPVRFTSFKHGVVSTNGNGLFDTVSSTPTIVTANDPFGTSAKVLEIAAAGAITRARWSSATPNIVVFSFYIKFPSALPSADCRLATVGCTDGTEARLKYVNASQKFGAEWTGGATTTYSGGVINVDQWYKIDFRVTANTNPHTLEWSIDEVSQVSITAAVAGSTVANCGMGTSAADTFTARYAYPVTSITSGDYPIPARVVSVVSPTDDGTHSPSTPDCIRGGGASPALISPSNKAFQYMDDVPFPSGASPTTDRINQDITSGHGTHYVEMTVSGFNSSGGNVQGVLGLLAYGGGSATANNGTTKALNSEGTSIDIFSGDMSETTVFYKQGLLTIPSGGWDDTKVNACKFQIGFSTDITPNPYWQGLMLEVMYFPSASTANTIRSYGFIIG